MLANDMTWLACGLASHDTLACELSLHLNTVYKPEYVKNVTTSLTLPPSLKITLTCIAFM